MTDYRASPRDGSAWVTGASSGIGRALALALAREGYAVAATARSADKLDELASEAGGLPGRIVAFPCDVTDAAAMRRTAAAIESELGPLALAVFNAGNYFPLKGERPDVETLVKTFEINLFGVVYGLFPAIEAMRTRGRGQVAVVGSLTAYGGMPRAGAYGASKAAVNSMAQSLKFDLDKIGIRIQVINPGFVETPLTDKNKFPMPTLVSVDTACAAIMRGLKQGGFEIAFPGRLAWALRIPKILPWAGYFWLMNRVMGWKNRPVDKV